MTSCVLIWHLAGDSLQIHSEFTSVLPRRFYTSVQVQGNPHRAGKEEAPRKEKNVRRDLLKERGVSLPQIETW